MTNDFRGPIGILGGTFDPIHFGHLRLAVEAAESCGLEQVRLIPAGTPPHRTPPVAPGWRRLQMARLAVEGCARIRVDDREVFKDAPCYTVETLGELRAELGPDLPLALIVGADAFLELTTWHRWRELFGLAHFVLAQRPGFEIEARLHASGQALAQEFAARSRTDPGVLRDAPAGAIVRIGITALDISASLIRTRLEAGGSVRYLLPDAVLDYIQANNLYPGAG
jgi:nicotinate-nucleotide adenylyltransferase